jgi:hypothetical protein
LDGKAITGAVAASMGLAPDDLELVLLEAVTWPDGCLGLAETGQVCSQALVEGWRAVVRLPDGAERRFRGGNGRVIAEPR